MKKMPKGGGKGARGEKLYTPVSQATINKIKKMGMTKALAAAGRTPKGQRAEFIQGVTRMYGAKRVAAARGAVKPAAKSADAARAAAMREKAPVAKTADEARARAMASTPKPRAAKKATGKGLFPGLLSGKYQGKKIVKGKVAGKGYFKS